MREVKAIKINVADFAPYGTFCNMTEPEGYPLQGEIHKFYPDRISGTSMGSIAFSPIAVRKDERIIKAAEYHTTTWEGIVALDDDMLIHVAPASGGTPVPEFAKAFLVPKGFYETQDISYMINGVEKTRTVIKDGSFQYLTDDAGNVVTEGVALFSGDGGTGFFNYMYNGIVSLSLIHI